MAAPLVTLTTDFGDGSAYVAAMKGALLRIHPGVHVLDLCHTIPPQDLRQAAWFLRDSIPWFPLGTLHVVVVDPGVGTERALLYVEVGGQRLLAPDNGCWTSLGTPDRVLRLTDSRYWHPRVSSTFHGRDILAPVAGHLARGVAPETMGVLTAEWTRLPLSQPRREGQRILGEVAVVDQFGNLISDVQLEGGWSVVHLGPHRIGRRVRTYGDAHPGELVALVGSSGYVEVAVVQGNAALRLEARVGTPFIVELLQEEP